MCELSDRHAVERTLRVLGSPRTLGVFMLALLVGCGGSSSDGGMSPDGNTVTVRVVNQVQEPVQIRYMYGRSTPSTLGTVAAGAEETYTFRYTGAGDLRLTGEFIERRSGTSNGIEDLSVGDQLILTINQRKELRLEKSR